MNQLNNLPINTNGNLGILRDIPKALDLIPTIHHQLDIRTPEGAAFMNVLKNTEGMLTAYNTIINREAQANGGDGYIGLTTLLGQSSQIIGLNVALDDDRSLAIFPTYAPSENNSHFTFKFMVDGVESTVEHFEASSSRDDIRRATAGGIVQIGPDTNPADRTDTEEEFLEVYSSVLSADNAEVDLGRPD